MYCARSWHSFCRSRHLEASDFDKWPGQQSLLISCPFPRPPPTAALSASTPLMCTFLLLPQTWSTCDEDPLDERIAAYGPPRCDLLTLIIEFRTTPSVFHIFVVIFSHFFIGCLRFHPHRLNEVINDAIKCHYLSLLMHVKCCVVLC